MVKNRVIDWKERYQAAHRKFQEKEYPASFRDFGWISTMFPDVRKSNGLTLMICYFLKWEGWRATRINTQGQYVEQKYKGRKIMGGWRPSTTRKGTADISATIKGRSCMLEIKTGRDKPSEAQLNEQLLERAAGGVYEFIYTPEDFFKWYDNFILI